MTPNEKVNKVLDEHPEVIDLMTTACEQVARSNQSTTRKVYRLREIADQLNEAFTSTPGVSPCKSGCSACCYQCVSVTSLEAKFIGEYIGIKPLDVKHPLANPNLSLEYVESITERMRAKYMKVPCTFLDDAGRCSIYPVRPNACRTHISLEDTPEPCSLFDKPGATVATTRFDKFVTADVMVQYHLPFGDIREFFPRKP